MSIATTGTLSATIMQWFEKKALSRLIQVTHLYTLTWKRTLETGRGKSVTWVRFGVQPGNTTPLTEGVLVSPTTVSAGNITTNLFQYGEVFTSSDLLTDTSVTPMEEAMQDQATNALAYTVDGVIRNEVMSSCTTLNSNLFVASTATTVAGLGLGDVMTATDLRLAAGRLARNNVPKFDGELYAAVISSEQGFSIRSQTSAGGFLDLLQRSDEGINIIDEDGKTINKKKTLLGKLFGLAIYESSLQPKINNGTVDVNYGFFFGDESLASVALSSQNMEMIRRGPSTQGPYDPLSQIGSTVGYKSYFSAKNMSEQPVATNNQRVFVVATAGGF